MRFSVSSGFEVENLGRTDYRTAGLRMQEVLAERIAGEGEDRLLLAEFEPVLTVGRGGDANAYDATGLAVESVERGGKATFHGPGQLVAYPIVRLPEGARDLHAYLHALEESLIRSVADFGLEGSRDPRNTGCWIRGHKVASVGVAVRRWVTWHGVALNVSTDLSWFGRFDPCGMESDVMTTMATELGGAAPEMSAVQDSLARRIAEVLRS